MRGIKIPFVTETMSNIAEALLVAVPIPMVFETTSDGVVNKPVIVSPALFTGVNPKADVIFEFVNEI